MGLINTTVRLWTKRGPNQFKIFDVDGNAYQPDFVVETDTEKLIIETKRLGDMNDPVVLPRAETAALWGHIATSVQADGASEKPRCYLLVPEDAVIANATVTGWPQATRESSMQICKPDITPHRFRIDIDKD